MNIDDNEQIEAHKVILTAVSPSPDQQKFEIEAYIQEMEQLKAEIMELKNVINKTNEEKQKQSNKLIEYRKELEIEKNKNKRQRKQTEHTAATPTTSLCPGVGNQ